MPDRTEATPDGTGDRDATFQLLGDGTAPIVDIGAFEFPATSCDLDGSGAVSTADLLALLATWGPCECPACPGDFDGDCSIGLADLAILLRNWG